MAYTSNPYCTLTDVHNALDPNMDTSNDAWLSDLIIQAQTDIDREIGYPFQTDGTTGSPTTRLFDGEEMDTLWIDTCLYIAPTGGVIEIQKDTFIGANGIWQVGTQTTIDITADIIMKPNNVSPQYILTRNSGLPFQEGTQNYSVTGVWGWPPMPGGGALYGQKYAGIPADITRATTRLVTHYYKMRDTNYADMMQDGNIRERYDKTMPADVVQVIERYKRRKFITKSL